MIPTKVGILTIALLLILDLVIAATRVSLSNLHIAQLDIQNKNAKRIIYLVESPRLGAILRFSQTLMRFGIAILSFNLLEKWAIGFQIIALLLIALFMLLIEFTIETNVLKNAEDWALRLGLFGRALLFIFTPFVILPLLLLDPRRITQSSLAQMTEDELKLWVASEDESGSLEPEERRMIYEIFQFGETMAREIMVPRIDVLALDEKETTLSSAVRAFLDSGYSRLPVYNESVDNILGFLYAKDLLPSLQSKEQEFNLRALLRDPYFIPETKKADDLLSEMQEKRFHMAIVVDEYGGVSGVVTLEDIIEEIIGEIQDEYDEREEDLFEKISEDEFLFLGRIDLDDFSEIIGTDLPEGDADTLAGFLYEKLGRVPQGGEIVRESGLLLTIEQVSARRIRRVRVTRENPLQEESEDEKNEE
ncbi:MAG: hypothetical protein DRI32_02850 [Chloroflexi bacterium]|nr:MAG: hypothetical protein DRI32_02850 [Chloroflexota bacterium]